MIFSFFLLFFWYLLSVCVHFCPFLSFFFCQFLSIWQIFLVSMLLSAQIERFRVFFLFCLGGRLMYFFPLKHFVTAHVLILISFFLWLFFPTSLQAYSFPASLSPDTSLLTPSPSPAVASTWSAASWLTTCTPGHYLPSI